MRRMMEWIAVLGMVCGLATAGLPSARAADASPVAVPDQTPLGSGPYRAIMEVDPSLPTHTLYHPVDLTASGKLPIVAWGNGACWNVGNAFRWFLSDIASYGYLVIAVGPLAHDPPSLRMPTPMAPLAPSNAATVAAGAAKLPPPATHSAQLIDAINWAQAENERPGSRFFHRIDTHAVAVMGQSCGGVQAIEASADPRVRTSVIWNSGLFPQPTRMAGGRELTKANLKRLHAPIAYISGDEEDIAFANANDDYERIQHLPALRAYGRGVTHGGTYNERNGGEFAGVAVGWLNWQLKADGQARQLFVGARVRVVREPALGGPQQESAVAEPSHARTETVAAPGMARVGLGGGLHDGCIRAGPPAIKRSGGDQLCRRAARWCAMASARAPALDRHTAPLQPRICDANSAAAARTPRP